MTSATMTPSARPPYTDSSNGSGGAHHAVDAALSIEAALGRLTAPQRRSAQRWLCAWPARASDPKRYNPVRPEIRPNWRRAHENLTGAGGKELLAAAAELAQWAGPTVSPDRLAELFRQWLPDAAVSPSAAAVTQRLLCDHASLVSTPWSDHVVAAEALEWFTATAKETADDVGLINEEALVQAAAQRGWGAAAVDALSESCGLETVLGRLALRDGAMTAAKAAAEQVGRPVTVAEVAELTGRSPAAAARALSACWSMIRTGPGLWTVGEARVWDDAAIIIKNCVDDAGVIDKGAWTQACAQRGWNPTSVARSHGARRVSGQLVIADTTKARTKAALLKLDRPATVAEIAKTANRTVGQLSPRLVTIKSVTRVGTTRWVANETRDGAYAAVAAAARRCSDDTGLIDETQLRSDPAVNELPIDELLTGCGFVRLHGQLAVAATPAARIKAALVHVDRVATVAEIATMTELTKQAVSQLLPSIASVTRTARGRSFANEARNGELASFAAAIRECRDDVGLIDEPRLRTLHEWSDEAHFQDLCDASGLTRLPRRLSAESTVQAAAKAALLDLNRAATLDELSEMTGRSRSSLQNMLAKCRSVQRITKGRHDAAGLFDVVHRPQDHC